jgi:uncharacterized protein
LKPLFSISPFAKKIIFSLGFLLLWGSLFSQKLALEKPNPPSLVVDRADVLAQHDEANLKKFLETLDDSSSNQICVVTIPSLNNAPIEDVAVQTFRAWGIGNKKTNNGILLLVAINDRKARIEVGYGLEGAIPDVVAKDIIRNNLAPAFKQQNYIGGITAAVNSLSKAAVGEYKVKRKKDKDSGNGIGAFIFIVIIIIVILANIGRGGGNGGYRRRSNLDMIAPLLFNTGGWGGGGNGGWSGGGGSSWGGFGGGSSGGGGASGDW